MSIKNIFPKILLLLIFFLILNIVTISLGDGKSSLTVVNKTEHFLHIIIENEPYLYISPEQSATHSTEAKSTMTISAFYSPGQAITGALLDTVDVPYTAASTGCTCSEDDNSFGDCTYNPPVGGAARREIKAGELIAE